ncbi:hypothetical protein [Orf virus]|uniref:Uncharacterized protein n=1 Tax=Orf virus TaxID=10258 RepID=A0A3G2KP87_ORFV|nr:hypothetical protein [Orf virus]QLI57621.1 hypothetical protein [Orf virus]QLI57752.1 hypothetical protein [Orf virus]WHS68396.1 hypothetical protein [Orf virus]
MEVLVIISIIVAVICLTGAVMYLLIELGLAAERANKRARVKKNMRKLATQLGNGSVESGIGPCTISRTMDFGPSRWDSDSEGDGDSMSTTSTSGGGTLPRVWVGGGPGPMYENFCGNGTRHSPTNDPGYHSRETLCSGPPRQAPDLPPTPKPDEVEVEVGPGSDDQQGPYEEPDPILPQEPEPPVQIEVTINGPGGEGEAEGEFFYDE